MQAEVEHLPKIGLKNGPASAPEPKKANPFAAKVASGADAKKVHKLQKLVWTEDEGANTSMLCCIARHALMCKITRLHT